MNKASWTNGIETLSGWWWYDRKETSFRIVLKIGNSCSHKIVTGSRPEWDNFKLIPEKI